MTTSVKSRRHLLVVAVLLTSALGAMWILARATKATAQPRPAPPPEVSVVRVASETVPVYREYPARTYARDLVEVRGRVDGYIERRTFDIGSDVKAGQLLYVLDVRPYQAEVERVRGALAQSLADVVQAEANLTKARQDVERLRPLVKKEAAAQQDLDNALAALDSSQAALEARKAAVAANRGLLRTAELNVEYATIRAPISGRIGDSLLQVGGLVSRTSPSPLTTIVPLDPIWVRFQISEGELVRFQRADRRTIPIELLLSDGTAYGQPGHIENTLNGVNTRTGTMEVQASFRNPAGTILPGQFARVRLRIAERRDAMLVPQKAVQELQGQQSVLTLGADQKVEVRSVVTGERVDRRWIIERGLMPGDTVIVEGLQKARPGTEVTPRAYAPPESGSIAQAGGR